MTDRAPGLRRLLLGLATATLLGPVTGCASLPSSAVQVLSHADEMEVYALQPSRQSNDPPQGAVFHGFEIIGRAAVKDPAARERIIAAVSDGVSDGGTLAKCFNPRHGIHAVRGGRTVDLVICFECSAIEVIEDARNTTLETADVRDRLDPELRALGVEPVSD